jgi:lipid A disaccharide synthetase
VAVVVVVDLKVVFLAGLGAQVAGARVQDHVLQQVQQELQIQAAGAAEVLQNLEVLLRVAQEVQALLLFLHPV